MLSPSIAEIATILAGMFHVEADSSPISRRRLMALAAAAVGSVK